MAALPPLAAAPPVAPAEAPAPVQASAFDAALQEALGMGGQMAEQVLTRLEGLQSRAAHLAATRTAEPPSVQGAGTQASHGRDQHHMLGVMLETYEMAIEAEIVSRAATTLTSSVNTLIKTQ